MNDILKQNATAQKKMAVITGASRGIGAAAADYFASRGYDVLLVATDEALLSCRRDELSDRYGVQCAVLAVDVCNTDQVRKEFSRIMQDCDRIDVLVNSAGIYRDDDTSAESTSLAAQLQTNVVAAQHMVNLCVDKMRHGDLSYIFNIASIAGVKAYDGIAHYAASKHALVGYSTCLSRDLRAYNVKVTALCPDVVATDMSAHSPLPNERKLSTDDIVNAFDFLLALSPAASVPELVIARQ